MKDVIFSVLSSFIGIQSNKNRERDFKSFYQQYDKRRGKNFLKAFPELREWYENIPETNLGPLTELIDGDDAKSNRYVSGVLQQAKDEGWVLNPQWSNPGSQSFIEPDEQQQDDMIDLVAELKKGRKKVAQVNKSKSAI